jgi:antitoxin VapB
MPISANVSAHDTDIDALAGTAQALLGTTTKADAIRIALERVIAAETERLPLAERVKKFQQRYKELGTPDRDFDMKAYMDEMWEI